MEKKMSEYMLDSKNTRISNSEKKLKIGILSSFTINGLDECLKSKSEELDIDYQSFVSGYNQYNQEILNENSKLYKFNPDITFLIIDIKKLLGDFFYFSYSVTSEKRKEIIDEKISEIKNLLLNFQKNSDKKLIISIVSMPMYSSNGILDNKSEFGFYEMINKLNSELIIFAKNKQSLFVYDFNQFIRKYGEKNIFDYRQFFIGDIQISLQYIPYFANELLSYIKPSLGINRKCIVLDLDNTLWGGIVGEDGFDGVELGQTPNGKAFVEFQKQLLALWEQGIILAVNSKNNFEDAMEIINEHPNMILREKNFACIRINWNDKAENLKQIANEINIGLNSIVFFDDDKINQERIIQEFPEVLTVNLPNDPSQYASILKDLNDFSVLHRTEEDTKRGEMYVQQRERNELQKSVTNLDEFLKQLDIIVKIKKSNEFLIPRISQLTLKTNQFNLTTRRYQENEIKELSYNSKFEVGCAQVLDKFGDNGITGVYIISKNQKSWIIDTFLLSCRIMGRGVEDAILSKILTNAKQNGVEEIKAEFIPTAKNKPAENFLENSGFKKENKFWIYKLNNDIKLPNHLKVEIE
tara:strand:- start:16631 stop:18376 length:1746 start_codon:yes stop_codon:yes gene_type:complete